MGGYGEDPQKLIVQGRKWNAFRDVCIGHTAGNLCQLSHNRIQPDRRRLRPALLLNI